MNAINDFIKAKEQELRENRHICFRDEEIQQMRLDEVDYIVRHFHGHTLMRLPDSEVRFFEWLKKEEKAVWEDLWEDDENLYLVSIDLLPQFLKEKNGFPICDLENEPNYYFTRRHIKPSGMAEMENIIRKTEQNEKLNLDELLLFELHIAPIDIWHFSHRYNLPLQHAKDVISDMVYKGWIVHLTQRDDLSKYIDV